MQVVDLNRQPKEEWRPGVMTQMYVSALNGATQLCVFEQWCEAWGTGRPRICTRSRKSCACSKGRRRCGSATRGSRSPRASSSSVPAGRKHGFSNSGKTVLRHPVHARGARVRGGLRRQARVAAALAAGLTEENQR